IGFSGERGCEDLLNTGFARRLCEFFGINAVAGDDPENLRRLQSMRLQLGANREDDDVSRAIARAPFGASLEWRRLLPRCDLPSSPLVHLRPLLQPPRCLSFPP